MAGNALSPAGLRIDRDYFPAGATPTPTPAPAPARSPAPAPASETVAATPTASAPSEAAAHDPAAKAAEIERQAIERLQGRGLGAIQFEEAKALFLDPLYKLGGLLFI